MNKPLWIELCELRIHCTLYLVVAKAVRCRGAMEFVAFAHTTSSPNGKFEKTTLNFGYKLKPSFHHDQTLTIPCISHSGGTGFRAYQEAVQPSHEVS